MNVSVGSKTDVGRVRQGNEDSFLVDAPLFVVADGMGGHLAGDVASATAIEVIQERTGDIRAEDPETLAAMVKEANRAIWGKGGDDPNLRGMGTTCTLVLLDGSKARIAHVGDSRAYLFHDGELKQITEDHTLVGRMVREGRLNPEDAERHPQRSVITRALGVDEDVEVDLITLDLYEGDRLLICSDGLSSMIPHPAIADVLAQTEDAQSAAEQLVERANEAGGEDNITVVVIDMGGENASATPAVAEHRSDVGERAHTDPAADTGYHRVVDVSTKRRRWPRIAAVTIVVIAVLSAGGFYAVRYALDNSWFVGVNDGVVTIYRGIPGEVAGVTLNEAHQRTDVELRSLPAFKRDEVTEGIKVGSLEEAEETVDQLQGLSKDPEFQSFRPVIARPF
jgi:protein phosphatase